ncbi:unnamed protein product, partial [Tilletia controversa]
AAPGPAAGAPAQQQVVQANAAQDQQHPQDRQAPANQAPAAGPAADADRQPRRDGGENNQANDPDLNDPNLNDPVPNDVPEGDQHRHEGLDITPEQLAEAEVLIANRKTWIQELAPELDKKARKDLTELAHNVIFTSEHTARDAFEMSLANIQHRRQIHEALGRELNTSSDSIEPDPAPPAQKAPSPAAAHPKKRQASEEVDRRAKKRQTSKGRSKKKGKSKSRTKDSSSDDDSSTDSSSCSSSSQRSFSSDDSSDSEDSSDEENPKWVAGKMNSRVWGSLNIPDRVARKVDKGEYVDLWWFTPQSLKLKHEEKSRKHLTLEGGTLRTAEPAKPSGFLEDDDLDWDDFLYAIDKWMDTMKDEDIGLKTRKAWDRFNSKVRKHQQRDKPRVKKALQILHQWQRKCFAHDTRQTKNKRKKIRRDTKMSDAEKAKKLDVLRQFDPKVWPKKNFKRILKDLKERSDDRVENELALFKASVAAGFNHSSTSAGPSRKTNSSAPPSSPHPSNRNSSKPKGQQSFWSGGNPQDRPCGRCGSKSPHSTRACMAEVLAADPSRPTFATNNQHGKLIKRDGGQRGQRCPLVTANPPPSGAAARS